MTELLDIGPGDIEAWGFEEKTQASSLKENIEELLVQIHGHEKTLAGSYVRLGLLTDQAIQGRCWIGWGFESSGAFVDSICDRIGRGRAAVYEFAAVAQKLLPQVSQGDLETMGISRASLLKKFVVQSQRRISPDLLSAALDGSIKLDEFREIVYNNLHQDQEPKGKWRSIGFFADDETWQEIQQAKALVAVDGNASENVIWREVVLAFAREFYSSNIGK